MAGTARLEALVLEAYEYAFPLQVVARTRWRALGDAANPQRQAPNTWQHQRALSDHRAHWITAPNNDTLYSNAWLDLSAGPVRLRVDAQPPGRYWSVAMLDAFTNHIAVVGQRCEGAGPVDVTLVGPADRVDHPPGRVIRAPGSAVWLFARCLVDGPQDLPEAHAMQDRLHLQGPRPVEWLPATADPGELDDPPAFLATVNAVLGDNPAPLADSGLLSRCAEVGLRPGESGTWERLTPAVRAAWRHVIPLGLARIRDYGRQGRRDFQGWVASAADIGNFGTHYALRASVALGGLGALEPVEAMYFVRYADRDGAPLDGRQRYRLCLPPGGIATDSFWSFTVYEPTPDGLRRLVDNPIGRYSIGDRTPGLVQGPDGSLTLRVQHIAPATPPGLCNWLPVPAGPFQIALRCYIPRASLREGTAAMPQVCVVLEVDPESGSS